MLNCSHGSGSNYQAISGAVSSVAVPAHGAGGCAQNWRDLAGQVGAHVWRDAAGEADERTAEEPAHTHGMAQQGADR